MFFLLLSSLPSFLNHYSTHCNSQIHPGKSAHWSSAQFFRGSPRTYRTYRTSIILHLEVMVFYHLALITFTDHSDIRQPNCLNNYLHCYLAGLWIIDNAKPAKPGNTLSEGDPGLLLQFLLVQSEETFVLVCDIQDN